MKPQEHPSGTTSSLEPSGPDGARLAQASQKTTPKADVGNQVKKHTISILVENRFGAFTRIAGLFAAKGYNIDSLSVGPTEEQDTSRMTIVTHGDDQIIEQIIKQLNKLIDTIKVVDLTFESFVERELALVKIQSTSETRSEIMQIAEIFRAKVVDISPKTLTLEATGSLPKVDAIIAMLKPFGIKELARTGRVALKREFQGEV